MLHTMRRLSAMGMEELKETEEYAKAIIERFSAVPFEELSKVKRAKEYINKAQTKDEKSEAYLDYVFDICCLSEELFYDNYKTLTMKEVAKIVK